jgi:hypothetical protein
MHIAKLLVTVSVLTLGASPLLAQRADNPAQADAREKLRQAEAQLDSQQGTPPANSPTTPAPAPQQPPPPITEPAPAPQQLSAPVAQPVPPPYQPPPVAPQPVAPPPTSAPATGKMTPEMEQQLRDQLHQAEAQLQGQQPSAPATPQQPAPVVTVKTTKPAKTAPTKVVKGDEWTVTQTTAAPVKNQKGQKIVAPAPAPIPTMLSGSKEQQLADLLQLYKSDKITPAEYHAQRAKILAQP